MRGARPGSQRDHATTQTCVRSLHCCTLRSTKLHSRREGWHDHLAHAVNADEADLVVLVEFVAVGGVEDHLQQESHAVSVHALQFSNPILAGLV